MERGGERGGEREMKLVFYRKRGWRRKDDIFSRQKKIPMHDPLPSLSLHPPSLEGHKTTAFMFSVHVALEQKEEKERTAIPITGPVIRLTGLAWGTLRLCQMIKSTNRYWNPPTPTPTPQVPSAQGTKVHIFTKKNCHLGSLSS